MAGYTITCGKQKMPVSLTPVEQTLDPGESIVPSAAVDVMTSIVALGGPPEAAPATSNDTSMATLVIGAIVIWIVIKLILRFLPWLLGIGVVIALLTML
jgi:hypothetical protein